MVTFAVNKDLSDDLVYNILDALWKHHEEFYAVTDSTMFSDSILLKVMSVVHHYIQVLPNGMPSNSAK